MLLYDDDRLLNSGTAAAALVLKEEEVAELDSPLVKRKRKV